MDKGDVEIQFDLQTLLYTSYLKFETAEDKYSSAQACD